MSGPNTADQVGPRYDIVIDGYGYVTARAVDPNLPFRTQQAALAYTPTFLERTNVGQGYGDNQQDFFLTSSQNDWSGGEDQKFFRPADPDSPHRYWLGSNVDVTLPGQVTLRPAVSTLSLAAAVSSALHTAGTFHAASSTNLYAIDQTGTIIDRGAHGAGGAAEALCSDGLYLYISGSGCTKVRKYDRSAHTFADFSATPAMSLCFLNNTLYGVTAGSTGTLQSYDTSGTATTIFTWKSANGTALAMPRQILPFGGKVAILSSSSASSEGAELWIYAGVAPTLVAHFPETFTETFLAEAGGVLFICGTETYGNIGARTVVYYYANGVLNRLFSSETWFTSTYGGAAVGRYQGGLLFSDIANSSLRFYDLTNGGVSTVAAWTPVSGAVYAASGSSAFLFTQATANVILFASNAAVATTGSVISSQIDFDNSLTKLFRGIKVDWRPGSDGDGGSVDLAYQIDSVSGSFTTLQTTAVSGTEYTLPAGAVGHTISVKVTLNKGTSTLGPVLKRRYVRAVPVLQAYRNNQFILDLGGTNQNPVRLRDGNEHTLTGEQMRTNLAATITAQAPVSITDMTGTYTGILEPAGCEFDETRPGQWYAQIKLREV